MAAAAAARSRAGAHAEPARGAAPALLHLGGYIPQRRLGRGAAGDVFEVRTAASAERYALKQIDMSGMGPKERELATQEATLLRSFVHPHIVKFVDLVIEGAMLCIVMQYLDGGDLHRVVDGARQLGRQLDEVDIWRWFLQVASALQYLHKERVLHRDVKPANIFLTSAGRHAVLGDLGIAKILPSVEARALTQIGTPAYLAPEVWQGRRYGYAADIYSLGCTVYELAELRMPFTAENRGLLAAQVCRKNSKPIEARLGYSPELTRIVQLMLSKDPRARPSPTEVFDYAQRIAKGVRPRQLQQPTPVVIGDGLVPHGAGGGPRPGGGTPRASVPGSAPAPGGCRDEAHRRPRAGSPRVLGQPAAAGPSPRARSPVLEYPKRACSPLQPAPREPSPGAQVAARPAPAVAARLSPRASPRDRVPVAQVLRRPSSQDRLPHDRAPAAHVLRRPASQDRAPVFRTPSGASPREATPAARLPSSFSPRGRDSPRAGGGGAASPGGPAGRAPQPGPPPARAPQQGSRPQSREPSPGTSAPRLLAAAPPRHRGASPQAAPGAPLAIRAPCLGGAPAGGAPPVALRPHCAAAGGGRAASPHPVGKAAGGSRDASTSSARAPAGAPQVGPPRPAGPPRYDSPHARGQDAAGGWGGVVPWRDRIALSSFREAVRGLGDEAGRPRDGGGPGSPRGGDAAAALQLVARPYAPSPRALVAAPPRVEPPPAAAAAGRPPSPARTASDKDLLDYTSTELLSERHSAEKGLSVEAAAGKAPEVPPAASRPGDGRAADGTSRLQEKGDKNMSLQSSGFENTMTLLRDILQADGSLCGISLLCDGPESSGCSDAAARPSSGRRGS